MMQKFDYSDDSKNNDAFLEERDNDDPMACFFCDDTETVYDAESKKIVPCPECS